MFCMRFRGITKNKKLCVADKDINEKHATTVTFPTLEEKIDWKRLTLLVIGLIGPVDQSGKQWLRMIAALA